jgi:U3 small nucleolar ribonucleoprotein protein LCP5
MSTPETSLPKLISSLVASLESSTESIPEIDRLLPPTEAQSLLNIKNDIFLSYIQNLVFLIVIKLQHFKATTKDASSNSESLTNLHREVVEKLVELRLYLDRGIKPLESRLTYQIDRVIRAAEAASRPVATIKANGRKRLANGKASPSKNSDESASASGSSDSDSDAGNLAARGPLRTNALRSAPSHDTSEYDSKSGLYKPPRIKPTVMPLPITEQSEARNKSRLAKSSTLDEFVDTELLPAPIAEPSIGSTIRAGGQRIMTTRERQDDEERRRYEEDNYIRLSGVSKKDKQQAAGKKGQFGGEEFAGLNKALDRLHGLTKRQGGSQLDRSRKRTSGFDSSGSGMGDKFSKRKRMM